MVGRREFAGSNGFAGSTDQSIGNGNVELGKPARPRPKIFKFQDAVDSTVEDEHREALKNKLLNGTDRNSWEKFRKSKDEVGESSSLVNN